MRKIIPVRSDVSIELRLVTDRQTDRQTDTGRGYNRLAYRLAGKNGTGMRVVALTEQIRLSGQFAIRKRKFLNKFSVIHNALCRVFVANAKTELESCCTDV